MKRMMKNGAKTLVYRSTRPFALRDFVRPVKQD